jgi:WD40 repeat protein
MDIEAHRGEVFKIALNHAGSLLASTSGRSSDSGDGKFRLWDTSTGQLLLSGPCEGDQLQFSDDDRYLLYADPNYNKLLEVTPTPALRLLGRASRQLPGWSWSSLVFSPDGGLLATEGEDYIRLWDLRAGKELAVVPEQGRPWFLPDGKSLIISVWARGLERWPIKTVEAATNVIKLGPRIPLSEDCFYTGCELSRNGRFLATAVHTTGTNALVFDFENPSTPVTLGPQSHVGSVVISPDGRFVATGGSWEPSQVKVWEVASRRVLIELTASSPRRVTKSGKTSTLIAFSPDSHWLATSADHESAVRVWDLASRQVIRELPASYTPHYDLSPGLVMFSPDGRWLAACGGNDPVYRLYRTGSWESRLQLAGSPDNLAAPNLVSFSPDGEILAIGNPPHNTHLYSTATGRRLAVLEPPHQAQILSLGFSPDGATLAVYQSDSVVQLWDLRQIRHELAALNLDWDLPAYAPAPNQTAAKPTRVEIIEAPAAAERRAFLARAIPPRPADAPPRLIDLSPFYNAALTESWYEQAGASDLSELTPGLRELAGVLFDVRGLIQLGPNPPDEMGYPGEIRGIRVNQVCARLHFLHSAIFADQTPAGTGIGTYIVHYADGRNPSFPIEVGNWLNQPQGPTNIVVAWTGQNEKGRKAGQNIRLFKTTWTNPFPSVPITRIDFRADEARPFLVAITAE